MPSLYLPYNVLRVLVVIVIHILVPSRDATGVRSIQKHVHRQTAPRRQPPQITAYFLIGKSRPAEARSHQTRPTLFVGQWLA